MVVGASHSLSLSLRVACWWLVGGWVDNVVVEVWTINDFKYSTVLFYVVWFAVHTGV